MVFLERYNNVKRKFKYEKKEKSLSQIDAFI